MQNQINRSFGYFANEKRFVVWFHLKLNCLIFSIFTEEIQLSSLDERRDGYKSDNNK